MDAADLNSVLMLLQKAFTAHTLSLAPEFLFKKSFDNPSDMLLGPDTCANYNRLFFLYYLEQRPEINDRLQATRTSILKYLKKMKPSWGRDTREEQRERGREGRRVTTVWRSTETP